MHELRSWTTDEATRFFSGKAVYEKTIAIPAALLSSGRQVVIDFGQGTPVPPHPTRNGLRAWLESPVRESAVVSINGQHAGAVWRPPYQLDVKRLLHAGDNAIRIEVGNLAINTLAGQSLPDYRLLNLRYGERFQQQDMDNLQPLPSGLLGDIKVVSR